MSQLWLMVWLFALIWIVGGIPMAIISEVMRAENPRTVKVARIAFALLLAADLLVAARIFSTATANQSPDIRASQGFWWLAVIAGGIPLALVSGRAVRRGYVGHRLVLAGATLLTAVLYLAFPIGYVPAGEKLTGLGGFEHEHHALGIVIMLVPTLILLADELRRKREVTRADSPEPLLD